MKITLLFGCAANCPLSSLIILKKNIKLNKFKHKPEIFNFGLSKKETIAYLYSNTNEFGKSESSIINYKNKLNSKKTEINLKKFLKEI